MNVYHSDGATSFLHELYLRWYLGAWDFFCSSNLCSLSQKQMTPEGTLSYTVFFCMNLSLLKVFII